MRIKTQIKQLLGELPYTAEIYWWFKGLGQEEESPQDTRHPTKKRGSWLLLKNSLPELVSQTQTARQQNLLQPLMSLKKMFVFSSQRYWIEYSAILSLAFAGHGNEVTLAYVPYLNWQQRIDRFEFYRQDTQVRRLLAPANSVLDILSILDIDEPEQLPQALKEAVREVSIRDVQYTLQVEAVDQSSDLFHLRMERNTRAAQAALTWLRANMPDTVLTPNGSILEMGVIYEVARYLDIPVVTYEFGEQRERIWMARNAEVMRQETDELWQARKDLPLDDTQWKQIRALYASRQHASLWENFARLWQGQPAQGGDRVRRDLGLDDRPVVLLPANVIGDSLTLGRQVFSVSMTDWLENTIQYFANRPDIQLIVRIHPGERYLDGPSVGDVAHRAIAHTGVDLITSETNHIRLIAADDPINTYDLIDIADLGLVYTTTVGMEMTMSGVPVMVGGQTHYRGKGFTLDPHDWDSFYRMLDQVLQDPQAYRLEREQVEQAWNYAYRFFFEYPLHFPWHLHDYWAQLRTWSLLRTLSTEGWEQFGHSFRCLAGEPREWDAPVSVAEIQANHEDL